MSAAYAKVKRGIDVLVSGALLAVTSPIQIALAVTVAVSLGRPVLFLQPRPGLDGRIFPLRKFRTMRVPNFDGEPDADRLTALGQFLRRSSLDELPELWNVLVGEMSLVGPRPLLVQYLDLYTPEQARRHEVRPGITGLAQVSGRNALSWADRFALDVAYIDSMSLITDLKILGRTVGMVLSGRGVTAPGLATVAPFTGAAES